MTDTEEDEGSVPFDRVAALELLKDLAGVYDDHGIASATACPCCDGLSTTGAVALSNINVDEDIVTADPGEMFVARRYTPAWAALVEEVDRRGWRLCANRYWLMVRGAPEPHPSVRREGNVPFDTLLEKLLGLVRAVPEGR